MEFLRLVERRYSRTSWAARRGDVWDRVPRRRYVVSSYITALGHHAPH